MNFITPRDHFDTARNVVAFSKESAFRFHLVFQSDTLPIPMKLTVTDNIVMRAEIPDVDGNLERDFSFYQDVVNDRPIDAWPAVTEDEFNAQLALYKQHITRRPPFEAHPA